MYQGDFTKSAFNIADVCDVCCQSPYYVIGGRYG